ncbi:hypothetical protein [Dokdonia donghaensis]|uniref:hypothetical protein n=1 Tax=Dokdonia donghaensis TaxID=326320 RepID=UPI00069041F0|nr:hypothetical protein [Dokdonia donghaensis]ANH61438.1 hypothetical protein I597_2541 [Dokdonia donghaensis DSW-1]
MTEKLIELQNKIYNYHNSSEFQYNLGFSPRISFSKIGEFYEIIFYGEGYDDDFSIHSSQFEPGGFNFGFCAFQDFLIENPDKVISLIFSGPDAGANGTRDWNFSRIINSNVIFDNLKIFKVALTEVGDHNQSVIGEYGEENGMIAKLTAKMPKIEELKLPSAPNEEFFKIQNPNIRHLTIQAGYGHQNFIENLANSTNITNLTSLDYAEPFDHFGDLEDDEFTSFESLKKLFASKVFSIDNFHFKLRENRLNKEQLEELQKINNIQLLHIKTESGKYVRM